MLDSAQIGEQGFDTDAVVTDAQLDAKRAQGCTFLLRAFGHRLRPDQDISSGEMARILGKGWRLALYQVYWTGPWSAADGAAQGALAAAKARELAWDGPTCLDLEGAFPDPAGAFAHAMAWSGQGVPMPVLYGAYALPFTTAQLDQLLTPRDQGGGGYLAYWTPGGTALPSRGPALRQHQQVNAPFPHDPDEVVGPGMMFADNGGGVPPRALGESAGQYLARLARPYAGCSLTVRRDELAQLVSRGGVDDPAQMVQASTNCATFLLGLLWLAGCRLPCVARRYLGGPPDAMGRLVYELGKNRGAYVPWKPGNPAPPLGAILHWAIPGTNDDHVGLCESEQAAVLGVGGSLIFVDSGVTEEAGGAGNSVNMGHHDARWLSWGRPLQGYIDPARIPCRAAVVQPGDAAAARAALQGRPTVPELVTGHAGELDDS